MSRHFAISCFIFSNSSSELLLSISITKSADTLFVRNGIDITFNEGRLKVTGLHIIEISSSILSSNLVVVKLFKSISGVSRDGDLCNIVSIFGSTYVA